MRFLILIAVCISAAGQKISIGVVGGANFTEDFEAGIFTAPGPNTTTFQYGSASRHFLVGPKVEVRFRRDFSLEVDAIYRELRSSNITTFSPPWELPNGVVIDKIGPTTRTHTTWQFPVLARYRLPVSNWNPFVAVGPSFRPAGTGTGLSHTGLTVGGGVEFLVSGISIAPAVRYTRWSEHSQNHMPRPLLNQVEFVVGFDKPSESAWPSVFGVEPAFGAVLGMGLTGDLDRRLEPGPRSRNNFLAGALVEVGLPKNLSVELNGLWRPLHFYNAREIVLTWQFPVLLKYRFPTPRIQPFVEAGPSFRASGNLNTAQPSNFGFTVGAGVEKRWGVMRLSPAIRYTRWQADSRSLSVRTVPDQVEFVVGVAFGRR